MAERHRDLLPARVTAALRLTFVALGVLSLVLGYLGLSSYLGAGHRQGYARSAGDLAYYDIELFLVQSTPLSMGGPFPWPLAVARFLAPCVSAITIIEFGVAVFAERTRRSRVRHHRGHAVVCGTTRFAAVLAQELRRAGTPVVTVGPLAGDRGAADYVVGDPSLAKILEEAGVGRAVAVYACLEDSDRNVEIADVVERLTDGVSTVQRIHAMVTDLDLCLALQARRWSTERPDLQRVDFFNPEELAAQQVVRSDDEFFESFQHSEPRIVVVGTGAFGRSVLVESARQWSARRGESGALLNATLVGADAPLAVESLRTRYPFLDEVCVLHARQDGLDDLLADHADPDAPRLHRLYLCHEDEGDALKAALAVTAHFSSEVGRTVVGLDRMAGVVRSFQGGAEAAMLDALDGRLRVVDIAAEACGPASQGYDLAESLARNVHQRYLFARLADGEALYSRPAVAPWEELPDDLRAANRAQARDVGRKMASIGCLLVPRSVRGPEFAYRDGEVEELARGEHDRWMVERRLVGWRYSPVRDDARRLHSSLRPWDELPDEVRELDREVVRSLPHLLAESGLALRRVGTGPDSRLTPTVRPPRAR